MTTSAGGRGRALLQTLGGPAVLLVILLMGPAVLSPQGVDSASLCALYLIAGVGLHVLMGFTGQVSFGQGGFWAIGAYGTGILTVKAGMPVLPAVLVAVVVTGLLALLIGWPVVQLRGHYVAVATLALALIVVDLVSNLDGFTGGSAGLPGVPSLEVGGHQLVGAGFYRLCWALALLVLVFTANVGRSRTGRAFRSVGADESGSQALGVPSGAYRLRAFVFAAVLAGLGGALYATYLGFLSADAFNANLSALFIIVIVVGGIRSPYGALVGAVVVTVLTQWLNGLGSNPGLPARLVPALNSLFYGAMIFLVMRFRPEGLLPLLQDGSARVRGLASRRGEAGAAPPAAREVEQEPEHLAAGPRRTG